MIVKARLICALAVLSTAAFIACGGSEETAGEAGGDAPAAVPTTPDAPKPTAVSSKHSPQLEGALPANFPEDIPVYPGADIAFSRASTDMAVAVRLFTDDDLDDVTSRVSDDFAAMGWATDITETPAGNFVVADKLSRKAAASLTQTEEGRTQIDILVTETPR